MAWLMIVIVSVSALWIASLCKILHTACSSSSSSKAAKTSFNGVSRRRNVLLVIAHPDDESMFFTPTINHLNSRGHNLHILCMSTGNADGMGNTRKQELYQACSVLNVPLQQVKIVDHPDLQDGFGRVWDYGLLAKTIEEEILSQVTIDLVITFDEYGVSGHCNHRDVNRGMRKLLLEREIEGWELVSTNILRKYSGPVDIWLSLIYATVYGGEVHCLLLVNEHMWKSYIAMAQHMSQFVWFRKLFVLFSSYTYVNTLRKINK